MATRKKKPDAAATLATRVIYQRGEGGPVWMLPTNPGYRDPNEIDQERGVDPQSPDAARGERAIAARVLDNLVPARMRTWIAEQMQRRGGQAGLARELVAMRPVPPGRDPKKFELAVRRAVERAGPATKPGRKEAHETGIQKAEYRERIGLLMLHDLPCAFGVYGRWYVEGDRRGSHYSWFYTDPYVPEQVDDCRLVLQAGGIGLIDLVESVAQSIVGGSRTITLEWLHALQVEARAAI